MKKSMCAFLLSLFALTLVACGDNVSAATTPEVSEEVDTIEYREFDGEGEGQGVIKSDDELSALEEEAEQYSSGEDYDTYVIESKPEEEKPVSKYKAENFPDYVPMDEFWVSENEVDLVAWYEANGAVSFYCDADGEETYEDGCNTAAYAGRLVYSYGSWTFYVGSDNYSCIDNSISDDGIVRVVYEYSSVEKNNVVTIKSDVNDFRTYRDTLEKMDEAMRMIKADPTTNKDFD